MHVSLMCGYTKATFFLHAKIYLSTYNSRLFMPQAEAWEASQQLTQLVPCLLRAYFVSIWLIACPQSSPPQAQGEKDRQSEMVN